MERLGQRQERRQADAAGDHPGVGRRIDRHERPPERSETGDACARLELVSSPVPTPIRLLRIEMPIGAPSASRRISKIENGRRSSGSSPRDGLTITN